MDKNYYDILGLHQSASAEEIKSSFRKLAHKYHPDKNQGDKFCEERFKEIHEAYEVLSDPGRRTMFDSVYNTYFRKEHNAKTTNKTNAEDNTDKSKREQQVRAETERLEKERVAKIKRTAQLQFEDKAWIFIGNWFVIPGLVGLWMFIKYRSEGYTKKANSVCWLTIFSFLGLLVLIVVMVFAKAIGYSRSY